VVAGLVAITPACSAVNPVGAIAVGAVAGVLCALAVGLKYRFGYDDSLDVVGVHLVGGVVGTLLIGLLGTAKAPAGVDGLLYGGGVDQLWRQAVAAGAVMAFSFVLAYVIGTAIEKTIGSRVDEEAEITGVDLVTHAESAYELGSVTGGGYRASPAITTQKERVDA
jgi:Amt family ammonium transporter